MATEIQRVNPKNREAFNVRIDPQSRKIDCELLGYFTDNSSLDEFRRGATRYPASSLRFDKVSYTSGTTNVVHYEETGKETLVTVWRDATAWACPRRLDTLSGHPSAISLTTSALREGTEEVLLLLKDVPLIPDFKNTSLSFFNPEAETIVKELAQKFGLPTPVKHPVSLGRLANPYFLENEPVTIAVVTGDDQKVNFFTTTLRPVVWTVDTRKDPLTFRESLGLETEGRVPERKIVEIDLKSTDVTVHEFGKVISRYPTFQDFIASEPGINSSIPFVPALQHAIMGLAGENELTKYAKELLRKPGVEEAYTTLK